MAKAVQLVALLTMAGGFLAANLPALADGEDPAFLHISDIHLNPFTPFAGRKLSPYGEDTNHALFSASLQAIAQAGVGADFTIVTGDLLVHDFEKKLDAALAAPAPQARKVDLAATTSNYVAEAIALSLPGKPIILALGNNDSDCGDYQIDPGGSYLAATRETVRRLAGSDLVAADFDTTYSAGGYYAMRHPTVPNMDILVLNDVLWSRKYRDVCGTGGIDAADAMLKWLEARLTALRAANRKAWLVHHIPIGIDAFATMKSNDPDCRKKPVPFLGEPFATRYPALLRDYASIIQANLTGHVHFDAYRLILDEKSQALGVEKLAPAISPVFGQNPAFLRFDYDERTGEPTDFAAIYLTNLLQAADPAAADWQMEYRFTEAYGQKKYDAAAVSVIWADIAKAGKTREIYGSYYDVSSPKFPPALQPAFYCAIGETSISSFATCMCTK